MANAKVKNVVSKIGTLDFETDPFLFGRVPYPFAAGIYFDDSDFLALWEPRVLDRLVAWFHSLKKTILLYAHNGGKFDFQYLLEDANPGEITIRNGRIITMTIGRVILFDTWPLMPFALAEYQKTKIDYHLFEKDKRNKHKQKIIDYMIDDCRDLKTLLTGFKRIVGPRDTIASAAFYQIRKMGIHIETGNETHDEIFRPYYYGGRNQAFQKGIFRGHFRYYDINSAYPFAMCTDHPHGMDYRNGKSIAFKRLGPQFVNCIADSRGALPLRAEDGSLSFPTVKGQEFFATGWEIKAGIQTRTLRIRKILDVWIPKNTINFKVFVDKVFALKAAAKKAGDKIGYLAYKFLSNSPYGKFAQDPRDFKDWILAPIGENIEGYDWEVDFGAISLWSCPSYNGFGFYDVATSASITGYVRAMLWRAYQESSGVLYMDTDSNLCKTSHIALGKRLGQWKLESCPKCQKSNTVTEARIAGKKLYGIKFSCGHTIVHTKGARLTWGDMLELCRGKTVKWQSDAPTFRHGTAEFLERDIHST